jgi:hypothetical protein
MKTESISAKEFIDEQVNIANKRGSKVRASLNTPEGRRKILISGAGICSGPKTKSASYSKYRNVKTVVDGVVFDSKKEAKRYQELKLMEKAGEIHGLQTQRRFNIMVREHLICTYIADFYYFKKESVNEIIIEDVKSEKTRKLPVYRIKKKLMKAIYNIDILET